MKKPTSAILVLSFLSILLLPLSASASEGQAPGYGNDLSQINGTPIKVGEHNEYYYDNKKFNLSVNPLGLMVDWYSVAGSVAVSNHVAIRGDLGVYAGDGEGMSTGTVGASIYFKKMYSGFFVEPGVGFASYSDEDAKSLAHVITGWHWTFDSGLNFMLGVGLSRTLDNNTDDTDVLPTGVFKVGYAL